MACPASPNGQHSPQLVVEENEDGRVSVKTVCAYCRAVC